MDPFITLSVVVIVALVIGGVWGGVVINELMKARTLKLQSKSDPRVDELLEDQRLLEGRVEQMEEELDFFRRLHDPTEPSRLARSTDDPVDGA